MSGFSVSIEKSVEAVTTLACSAECSLDALRTCLDSLAQELDQANFAALALITETISQTCANTELRGQALQATILDLCERLVQAAQTDEPFDFEGADPNLVNLIFPAELPLPNELNDTCSFDSAASNETSEDQLSSDTLIARPDAQVETCPCDDDVLLDQFITEASELIENAQNHLLILEKRPSDSVSLNELFRSIHSIKGAAGVCELDSLIDVAHVLENVLDRVREGTLLLANSVFHVTLRAVDFLALQLQSLKEAFQSEQPLHYPAPPRILMECLEIVDDRGEASSYQLAQLDSKLGKDVNESQNSLLGSAADSLRVDGKKLELLVNLIGELVITEGFVQRELANKETSSASSAGIRLKKVVRDIQQLSLSLKMVPIGSLLQKMNRLVRELSTKLNKPAQVVIRGAETEIDKTLLESLADPLVHLIRNSLDHGIESSVQSRVAAGKPEIATIEVNAEHRSGNVHISISDDGAGLDREKIRQRAIERGLIGKDVRLSDREIDALIFTPGFSTAQSVSEISGRGVGMDVVQKNVEALRGNILVQSSPGKGTIVRLEFPLTLSIIDGTVVKVGRRWFIFPTVAVIEQIQLDQLSLQSSHAGNFIHFRDRYVHVCLLGEIVGADHQRHSHRGQVCMVVEAFGQRHGLVVDEILGQQSIVIKPLGPVLRPLSLFAGCALLATGEIAFVLDVNAVCRRVNSSANQAAELVS